MRTTVQYSLEGTGRNAFLKALPEHLRRFKSYSSSFRTGFLFDVAELDPLRELDVLAREAGFTPLIDYRFDASDEPLQDDRMYVLSGKLVTAAHFNFLSLAQREPCASCGHDLVRLASNDDFKPHLKLTGSPPSNIFAVESGRAYFIAESLSHPGEGVGRGCRRRLLLVRLAHRPRQPVWKPSSPCPSCGRELVAGGLFPLLRRPDRKVDIGYSFFWGQTVPLLSGRVARALANEIGVGFGYLGWFPEDFEAATYPSLALK